MGEAFRDVDVSRVIYLLLYLFLVIGGLGSVPMARRRAKPPVCSGCQTPVKSDTPTAGPWGGWTCAACGASVDPVIEPPPRKGLRGWMDDHPWAVGGAVWGLAIWVLLAGRDLWIHAPIPDWETFPLTVLAGLGIGWLISLKMKRR